VEDKSKHAAARTIKAGPKAIRLAGKRQIDCVDGLGDCVEPAPVTVGKISAEIDGIGRMVFVFALASDLDDGRNDLGALSFSFGAAVRPVVNGAALALELAIVLVDRRRKALDGERAERLV
jgi:hypothetical protein